MQHDCFACLTKRQDEYAERIFQFQHIISMHTCWSSRCLYCGVTLSARLWTLLSLRRLGLLYRPPNIIVIKSIYCTPLSTEYRCLSKKILGIKHQIIFTVVADNGIGACVKNPDMSSGSSQLVFESKH
jgi:hypothetical protein